MIRTVLVGVTALVMSLWMPVLLLTPEEPIVDDKLLIIETEAPAKKETMILLKTEGKIVEMPVEEYLVGVLLSEMPASFEMEALKAQAVAARTFTLRQMAGGKHEDCHLCADSGCCQAWTSSARLSEKLGEQYRKKAELAVDMTEGEVLLYEGELIDAVYFSCSGGATEDAVAVWGGNVPYLVSVDSPGEENALRYRTEKRYTFEELRELLPEADLSGSPSGWFGTCIRTDGGGVASLSIGGVTYKGTELRQKLGLASTMFEVELSEDGVVFLVKGFGHRVGMSQYGADAMAQKGADYRTILRHYYTGVEIKTAASLKLAAE